MNELPTPNPASESLQAAFIAACTALAITPRQAWLLSSIWQYRQESENLAIADSMLAVVEFSPDCLPCAGECQCRQVSVVPASK